jgi:hypothetical protein
MEIERAVEDLERLDLLYSWYMNDLTPKDNIQWPY